MIYDISVALHNDVPSWPGVQPFQLERYAKRSGTQPANVSRLSCDAHCATHVDAPCHFSQRPEGVDQLALETLIGLATVVEFPQLRVIDADHLAHVFGRKTPQRLLLHTDNSALWGSKNFHHDYCALSPDGARWLVETGCALVGIDYLSIQRFGDGPETHEILLGAGIVVVEGLDLSTVPAGDYELLCLPLKLQGADGAPARVVLRNLQQKA